MALGLNMVQPREVQYTQAINLAIYGLELMQYSKSAHFLTVPRHRGRALLLLKQLPSGSEVATNRCTMLRLQTGTMRFGKVIKKTPMTDNLTLKPRHRQLQWITLTRSGLLDRMAK